jgi:5-methylcytosine-specific restriction endonuclease McrA
VVPFALFTGGNDVDFERMTDIEIFKGLEFSFMTESKLRLTILEYIKEVSVRKLYLQYDCTSLFQFLTEKFKLSPACVQSRIDAARLLKEIPAIAEDIKSGDLNLTQMSIVARSVREKSQTQVVEPETKRELLREIKGLDLKATQACVCAKLEIAPVVHEKIRVQADRSSRTEATFSEEQIAEQKRVRELVSHAHPHLTFEGLVDLLTKDFLQRNDPELKATSLNEVTPSQNRSYVPRPVRRIVFKLQKCCQHKNSDGRICGSTFQLQIDHIVPLWAGGGSEIENLQALCGVHNRMKYRNEAGSLQLLTRHDACDWLER